MQTHVAQLTKQRLSDFFVKEDGHVAHKNALIAGTVATGAILASVFLAPDVAEAHQVLRKCGDEGNFTFCNHDRLCCSGFHHDGEVFYYCAEDQC